MARNNSTGPETQALRSLVSELPDRVADWTPEQRQTFTEQSDRSMHEQNATRRPDELN
ncbi:hypothetical protein [Streptomyces coerulescens]|uniref:Uncharacterized protein n=1 Tax=Streptomyces coerulescens TaxID=29304 RepID=A0ABW0CN67_STRCD